MPSWVGSSSKEVSKQIFLMIFSSILTFSKIPAVWLHSFLTHWLPDPIGLLYMFNLLTHAIPKALHSISRLTSALNFSPSYSECFNAYSLATFYFKCKRVFCPTSTFFSSNVMFLLVSVSRHWLL